MNSETYMSVPFIDMQNRRAITYAYTGLSYLCSPANNIALFVGLLGAGTHVYVHRELLCHCLAHRLPLLTSLCGCVGGGAHISCVVADGTWHDYARAAPDLA